MAKRGRPIVDPENFPCGHPRSEENTRVRQNGTKLCRACSNAKSLARYQAVKASETPEQRAERERRAKEVSLAWRTSKATDAEWTSWYHRNRDRAREVQREWRDSHRENLSRNQKRWYDANREEILRKRKEERESRIREMNS